MTQTEQRYAQIEKEMLAIVHACSKFDHYIYGKPKIIVESDHKPLQRIFKKLIFDSPKRLQRMLLFLQKYDLEVTFKPGKEMYIADTLSRAYLKSSNLDKIKEVMTVTEMEICEALEGILSIHYVSNSKQRLDQIRAETGVDETLQKVIHSVRTGWPDNIKEIDAEVRPYYQSRDELVEEDGILFKLTRIVIPAKMRLAVMKKLHASHIGIENSLQRAREHVYWPRMNSELKDLIS